MKVEMWMKRMKPAKEAATDKQKGSSWVSEWM